MLIITIQVNASLRKAIGIKEQIAQDLERFGDTRVVSVVETQQVFHQMEIGELNGGIKKK